MIPLITEEEREAAVDGYAAALNAIAAGVEADRAVSTGTAVATAHVALSARLNRLLDEAARRVRAERGLPASPAEEEEERADEYATHHARGVAEAERALRVHGDGTIEDDALELLLSDLLHWAGDAFDDALDAAVSQYNAEADEDAENAEAAVTRAAEASFAGEDPAERRLQQARFQMLMAHRPGRADA